MQIYLVWAVVLASSCSVAFQVGNSQDSVGHQAGAPITFKANNTSPLRAIVQIARDNRLPMGIILGSAPVLCTERPATEINAPDAKTALEQALTDTPA